MTLKRCRTCGEEKPVGVFKADNRLADGRRGTCRSCIKQGKNSLPEKIEGKKRCPRCKEYKEATLDNFGSHILKSGGYCRPCINELSSERWGTMPSHSPEHRAAKRNREYVKKRNDEQHARIRADPLLRAARNLKARQYKAAAYQRDPQKFIIKGHADRARRQQSPGEFSKQDLALKFREQNGKCIYCDCDVGASKDALWSVEHLIPLSRGGTNFPDNIAIACRSCNFSKCDKMPHEFMPELCTRQLQFEAVLDKKNRQFPLVPRQERRKAVS